MTEELTQSQINMAKAVGKAIFEVLGNGVPMPPKVQKQTIMEADDLDKVEIIMKIEQELNISVPDEVVDLDKLITLKDYINLFLQYHCIHEWEYVSAKEQRCIKCEQLNTIN